jgi:hypothetical protein
LGKELWAMPKPVASKNIGASHYPARRHRKQHQKHTWPLARLLTFLCPEGTDPFWLVMPRETEAKLRLISCMINQTRRTIRVLLDAYETKQRNKLCFANPGASHRSCRQIDGIVPHSTLVLIFENEIRKP